MAEYEDNETEGLIDIMEENSYFVECFRRYDNVISFIKRDEHIYARAVTVDEVEEQVFLNYSLDVDGCVVEMKSLQGLKLPVRQLTILPNGLMSICEIQSMLNKHVDLSLYSYAELANFRHSVGFQLFYEHGWECWLGLLPCVRSGHPEVRKDILKEQSFLYFTRMKTSFQRNLRKLCLGEQATRTLMKNDLNCIDRLVVLPNDCSTILQTLQKSIEECPVMGGFRAVIFCFRFGEKNTGGVSLSEFEEVDVSRVTVHSAINLESNEMELFWSTSGIQEVVGRRGMLYTCASFTDCGNYRSNLDGRALDISKELRSVCFQVDKLRFVQLYADLAHRRPRVRFHPVTGCIAGGMVFPKTTSAAFKRDASSYLSALETNFYLMQRSICRLECVIELARWKEMVIASDCLNVDKVFDLLKRKPMLVPFPKGTMRCIQDVGLTLTSELKKLLDRYSGTGNVEATWKAYQLELSVEKMLWGYPLCGRSSQYSVSLGPGKLECSRSLTDYLGFLALERWTACMTSEDSIPPCKIWTNSEVVAKKLLRTAGIHDILHSSNFVLGRRLLDTLIEDLFEVGKVGTCIRYEEYKKELFRDKPKGLPVNGAVTVKQLVGILSSARRMPVAMAYGSVCELLRKCNINLEGVLKDGLVQMELVHFPALVTYDINRHAIINWSLRCGLWRIIGREQDASEFRRSPGVLKMLVVAELERRNLVFISKLKEMPSTLPWIKESARKLYGLHLADEGLVMVLSFVSCIALVMNGWYIEYNCLERLMRDMPVNQYRLHGLEIQSKLLLKQFNRYKLFRLHHTISFRLPAVEQKISSTKKAEKIGQDTEDEGAVTEVEINKISEDVNIINAEDVSFRAPTSLPQAVNTKQQWTSMEVELLHKVASRKGEHATLKSLYAQFRQKCMENEIPFRTFRSFETKFSRLQ